MWISSSRAQTHQRTLLGVHITSRLPHPDTAGSCHRCLVQPCQGSQPAAFPDTRSMREGLASPHHRLPGDLQGGKGPQPSLGHQGGAAAHGGAGGKRAPLVEGANAPPRTCGTSPHVPSSPAAAPPNAQANTQFSSQTGSQAQPGAPTAARAGGSWRGALKESLESPALGSRQRGAGALG